MDAPSAQEIRDLIDRQQILDCIHRYCRGLDRLDRELALSAYHCDAYDDHAYFCGPAAEFIDFTIRRHGEEGVTKCHQHYVTNHRVEIDGDLAHAETYFIYVGTSRLVDPETGLSKVTSYGGRYLDRFERRNGRWGIADRVCLTEWSGALKDLMLPIEVTLAKSGSATRDKSDLSYRRPLCVART